MNRLYGPLAISLSLLFAPYTHAQNCQHTCQPKPCAPKPCNTCNSSPPKPCNTCKSCPPKPCAPKPCNTCKRSKPCPPVCIERGLADEKCCLKPAYNEPAGIELNPCQTNVWFDASFTYWTAYEEGLDLAITYNTAGSPIPGFMDTRCLFQKTDWQPGFKIGFGSNIQYDHWSIYAEYTWFRSKSRVRNTSPPQPAVGTVVWEYAPWFLDQSVTTASSIGSVWHIDIDLLDAALTRPYYQGRSLIIAPFGGMRAAWIRQNLRIESIPMTPGSTTATQFAVFNNRSNSWALGPRSGIQGKWLLGSGFRLEGDGAFSISFTQYTKVAAKADPTAIAVPTPYSARYKDYNTLRVNADMNLGLGWSTYADCRNYHFDLLASYDFQIFWNQNMMRQLADTIVLTSGSAQNLYLQGLTIKAQLYF